MITGNLNVASYLLCYNIVTKIKGGLSWSLS